MAARRQAAGQSALGESREGFGKEIKAARRQYRSV
jgi:hypothetical protein